MENDSSVIPQVSPPLRGHQRNVPPRPRGPLPTESTDQYERDSRNILSFHDIPVDLSPSQTGTRSRSRLLRGNNASVLPTPHQPPYPIMNQSQTTSYFQESAPGNHHNGSSPDVYDSDSSFNGPETIFNTSNIPRPRGPTDDWRPYREKERGYQGLSRFGGDTQRLSLDSPGNNGRDFASPQLLPSSSFNSTATYSHSNALYDTANRHPVARRPSLSPHTSFQSNDEDFFENGTDSRSPDVLHGLGFPPEITSSSTPVNPQRLSTHSIRTLQSEASLVSFAISRSDSVNSYETRTKSIGNYSLGTSPTMLQRGQSTGSEYVHRNNTLYMPYNFYVGDDVDVDTTASRYGDVSENLVTHTFPGLPSSDSEDDDYIADIFLGGESPRRVDSQAELFTEDLTLPSIIRNDPEPLVLPKLPFSATSLHSLHYLMCRDVSHLTALFEWSLLLRLWSTGKPIRRKEYKRALVKLLVHHRKEIPADVINRNADQIIHTFAKSGGILLESNANDEIASLEKEGLGKKEDYVVVFYEDAIVNGVLPDLSLCYSYSRVHDPNETLKCFSNCYLNKKIDEEQWKSIDVTKLDVNADWDSFWKLTPEDLKRMDRTLIKKQSHIFEFIRFEKSFSRQLKIYIESFIPRFIQKAVTIIGRENILVVSSLQDDLLGVPRMIYDIHYNFLLLPLLNLLKENGKFITDVTGMIDIYFKWAQEIRPAILKHAEVTPYITGLLLNNALNSWVDDVGDKIDEISRNRLNPPWMIRQLLNDRFMKLPPSFSTLRRLYKESDPEFAMLKGIEDRIKTISVEINTGIGKSENRYAIKGVARNLEWDSHPIKEISWDHPDRKFFFKSDLKKKETVGKSAVHLILFDNYLFITQFNRKAFKVISSPIPIEYLLAEDRKKDLETTDEADAVYSFRVRFAGRGKSYIFLTELERLKDEWLRNLKKARAHFCLKMKNLSVFNIKLISNTSFAYDYAYNKLQICALNDPIEEMCTDARKHLQSWGYKGSLNFSGSLNRIVKGEINCATWTFHKGVKFYFVGMSQGIYCSDLKGKWKCVISEDAIKMLADANLELLVIMSSKGLRYYLLTRLIQIYSDNEDYKKRVTLHHGPVLFFEMAQHKGMTTIFWGTKKSSTSTATNFLCVVPSLDRRGVFSSFKTVKEFYVESECLGMSVFNQTFAVHAKRGIEILRMDKLLPTSIPAPPSSPPQGMNPIEYKARLRNIFRKVESSVEPKGVFKFGEYELLLVYSDFAIFTNRKGGLSRLELHEFHFRADSVAFVDDYLILVCDQVIEVWEVRPDRRSVPKQVIIGKGIRLVGSGDNLYFTMANPLVPGLQCLFELELRIPRRASGKLFH